MALQSHFLYLVQIFYWQKIIERARPESSNESLLDNTEYENFNEILQQVMTN